MDKLRSGFYELDIADVLHFDTRSENLGVWFPLNLAGGVALRLGLIDAGVAET